MVTRYAVSFGDDPEINAPGATVWGLVRSAQSEYPGRVVLVDIDGDEASWAALPDVVLSGESQVAVRHGLAHIPRLTPTTPQPDDTPAPTPDWTNGTILITGATGALGTLITQHLVHTHGARHLHLISRNKPTPQLQNLHNQLTQHGAHITHTPCDLTDPQQLTQTLNTIPHQHPLTTVIHCAGTTNDATLTNQTPHHLTHTFTPKATAAWHLHHHTQQHNPHFILFSSAAATLGSPGQANYAAANAYLDALAHHRHTHNQPTTSLAWGLWNVQDGMAGALSEADLLRMARTGITPIDHVDGLALFDAAVASGSPHLVPLQVNRAALRRRASDPERVPSVLHQLMGSRPVSRLSPYANGSTTGHAANGGASTLADALRELPAAQAQERLTQLVRDQAAAILGHESGDSIVMERPFTDLGFDSLMAVEFRGALGSATGLRLPATVVFDHPTPAALLGYLQAELLPEGGAVDPDAIFVELDRLESSITQMGAEDSRREQVRARLNALLGAWGGTGLVTTGERGGAADHGADLESASLEEVFGIIDDEFDLS
nr:type I polyketide synthase [Streptomyces tsukubensis]